MGKKDGKPWSFGLLGGKNGTHSIIAFIIIIIVAVLTHVGGAIYGEMLDRRERPVIALKSVLRDVREFINKEKRVPQNFREIEIKIWNEREVKTETKLHGNTILVMNNYEYIYHAGTVEGANLVCVWAIPLGKYREQNETVLLMIMNEGEQVWRGPAFNDEQREFVLRRGFNPTFPDMSQLNMKKDQVQPQQQKKKRFGIF